MNSINTTASGYNPDTDDDWLDLYKERIRQHFITLMVKVINHKDSNVVDLIAAPPAEIDNAPAAAK